MMINWWLVIEFEWVNEYQISNENNNSFSSQHMLQHKAEWNSFLTIFIDFSSPDIGATNGMLCKVINF